MSDLHVRPMSDLKSDVKSVRLASLSRKSVTRIGRKHTMDSLIIINNQYRPIGRFNTPPALVNQPYKLSPRVTLTPKRVTVWVSEDNAATPEILKAHYATYRINDVHNLPLASLNVPGVSKADVSRVIQALLSS